jgi:hypothetical protein
MRKIVSKLYWVTPLKLGVPEIRVPQTPPRVGWALIWGMACSSGVTQHEKLPVMTST